MSKQQETAAAAADAAVRTEMGWKCPYTHKAFSQAQLTGYGNPPRSPGCPAGTGAGVPMTPVRISITETGEVAEIPGAPIQ